MARDLDVAGLVAAEKALANALKQESALTHVQIAGVAIRAYLGAWSLSAERARLVAAGVDKLTDDEVRALLVRRASCKPVGEVV